MSVAVRSLKVQSPMFDESIREKAEMEKECEEDEGKKKDLAEMVNKPDILNPGHHDVLLGRGGGEAVFFFS